MASITQREGLAATSFLGYTMPRFRKKPLVIDAFRLGQAGNPTPAPEWFGSPHPSTITNDGLIIKTLEGDMLANWGDWIIRGVEDEIYPCKPHIFEATYELVSE